MGGTTARTVAFMANPLLDTAKSVFGLDTSYKGRLVGGFENRLQADRIYDIEDGIKDAPVEHLYIVYPDGTEDYFSSNSAGHVELSYNTQDVRRGKYHNAVIAHNHPEVYNASPSWADVKAQYIMQVKQVRVVDASGYSSTLTKLPTTSKEQALKSSTFGSVMENYDVPPSNNAHSSLFKDAEKIMLSNMPLIRKTVLAQLATPAGLKPSREAYNNAFNTVFTKIQSNIRHEFLIKNAKIYGYDYRTNADYTSLF